MKKTQEELQYNYDMRALKINEARNAIGIHTSEWIERKKRKLDEEIEACEDTLNALEDMQATLTNIETDTLRLEKLIGAHENNQRVLREEEGVSGAGHWETTSGINEALCDVLEKSPQIDKAILGLEDLLG